MASQANNINFINNSVCKRTMLPLLVGLFPLFVQDTFFAYVLRFVAFFSRRLPSLVLFKFRACPRRESLLVFLARFANDIHGIRFQKGSSERNGARWML